MIKLSYHALADLMSCSPATQRKTLIDYKYPDEDEPLAKRLYYREARDAIRAYHVGRKDSAWLAEKAVRLGDTAALTLSPQSATRLRSNSRALGSYAEHYDSDKITLQDPFRAEIRYGEVIITVSADLHGTERKKEKIVRLDYSRQSPEPRYCLIAAQVMYESACIAGKDLPTSAFVIRHIESAQDFAPARKNARILRDIIATCENIEAIWPTL